MTVFRSADGQEVAPEFPVPQKRIYAFIFFKHGGKSCKKLFMKIASEYFLTLPHFNQEIKRTMELVLSVKSVRNLGMLNAMVRRDW
jgi:hypothetical protein